MISQLLKISILLCLMGQLSWAATSGKDIWKNQCVACHEVRGAGPKAGSHFASIQWDRFIKNNRHDKISKINLSEDDKSTLLEYLKGVAADSDSPEIAGIR